MLFLAIVRFHHRYIILLIKCVAKMSSWTEILEILVWHQIFHWRKIKLLQSSRVASSPFQCLDTLKLAPIIHDSLVEELRARTPTITWVLAVTQNKITSNTYQVNVLLRINDVLSVWRHQVCNELLITFSFSLLNELIRSCGYGWRVNVWVEKLKLNSCGKLSSVGVRHP